MSSASELRVAFSNALRAFQTGGISYGDFLTEIDRQRSVGASSDEMLATLQRREYVEPLSGSIHAAVVAHLRDAPAGPPAAAAAVAVSEPWMEVTSPIVAAAHRAGSASGLSKAADPADPAAGGPVRRSVRQLALAGAASVVLLLSISWLLFRSHPRESTLQTPAAPRPAAVASAPAAVPDAPDAAMPRVVRQRAEPGRRILDCPNCPEMVVLPPGQFIQGAAADPAAAADLDGAASSQAPPHAVTIARPLALGTSDITVVEFRPFIAATGRPMRGCDTYEGRWRLQRTASWLHPGFVQNGSHPVTCVSWDDAAAYAAWLSSRTGHRYRLPTAAEWEYAAQPGAARLLSHAGTPAAVCAVANVADRTAARRYPGWNAFNCEDGYVYTSPVGVFGADASGLNDMFGNVFQWTEDCWHADHAAAPGDGRARSNAGCKEHELRGGSWFSSPRFVSAVARNHFPAGYRTSSVGFRLARDLD